MRNIDKIRDKLKITKITSRLEAWYICLKLRQEGFYIKRIEHFVNVEYILTQIEKK